MRYFIHQDGQVQIMTLRAIERLFGILRHDGPTVTLEEIDHAKAEGAVRD